jgi:hypothetical protein
MANAITPKDRYIIYGVSDDRTVCGVDKKLNSDEIHALLQGAKLNRFPSINITSIKYEGKDLSIIEIKNMPEKPYFLMRNIEKSKREIKAGVIYSRVGGTNTPINEYCNEDNVKKMFIEQLGLDKTPTERIILYLKDVSLWKNEYDENNVSYIYHQQFPEFTIVIKDDNSTEYAGKWARYFPDSKAFLSLVYLKYHTTILRCLSIVVADGGRYMLIRPEEWYSKDYAMVSYYYIRNSVPFLLTQLINNIYKNHIQPYKFSCFKSNLTADRSLKKGVDGTRYKYYENKNARE